MYFNCRQKTATIETKIIKICAFVTEILPIDSFSEIDYIENLKNHLMDRIQNQVGFELGKIG